MKHKKVDDGGKGAACLLNGNFELSPSNSASSFDNIFVNNPEQVLLSGYLITDVSDHFLQFCILTSTRYRIKQKQI